MGFKALAIAYSSCIEGQGPVGMSTTAIILALYRSIRERAGPYIAHLESQYSWAQIRLAAYILGSRPSAQVPEPSTW